MTILNVIEIANRAEEKADAAVAHVHEVDGHLGALTREVAACRKATETLGTQVLALDALVRQSLRKLGETADRAHRAAMQSNHDLGELTREVEDSKVMHLRDELREAQRRLDSMRARDFMQRRLAMNNKWMTGFGVVVGAVGLGLTALAQQHIVGASMMGVALAITALGKSLMEASAK